MSDEKTMKALLGELLDKVQEMLLDSMADVNDPETLMDLNRHLGELNTQSEALKDPNSELCRELEKLDVALKRRRNDRPLN